MSIRFFLAAFLIVQLAVGSVAQQPQPSPPSTQRKTPAATQQTPQSGDDEPSDLLLQIRSVGRQLYALRNALS